MSTVQRASSGCSPLPPGLGAAQCLVFGFARQGQAHTLQLACRCGGTHRGAKGCV